MRNIPHNPSATVVKPIPPAASKLTATAKPAAPNPAAETETLRQSGTPKPIANPQLAARISQRTKDSSPVANGPKSFGASAAANAQPDAPQAINQPVRSEGAGAACIVDSTENSAFF